MGTVSRRSYSSNSFSRTAGLALLGLALATPVAASELLLCTPLPGGTAPASSPTSPPASGLPAPAPGPHLLLRSCPSTTGGVAPLCTLELLSAEVTATYLRIVPAYLATVRAQEPIAQERMPVEGQP